MTEKEQNSHHRLSEEQRRALASMDPDIAKLIVGAWSTDEDTAVNEPHFPAEWLQQHNDKKSS